MFDGRIPEVGEFGLNQHFVLGRRGRSGDGAPNNGALLTSEIGYATAPWHEVAVYVPAAVEFGGRAFGGGFKLRNSFVVPGAATRPVAYGFDVELRHQPFRFADANWSLSLRPILDLRRGPWQLILNPAVELPLGRNGPVFAPAVRGVRQVAENVWIGLENFADFGRFDRWETPRRQSHQAFLTTDIKFSESLALHVGIGHGLTRASDRWAGKVILQIDF